MIKSLMSAALVIAATFSSGGPLTYGEVRRAVEGTQFLQRYVHQCDNPKSLCHAPMPYGARATFSHYAVCTDRNGCLPLSECSLGESYEIGVAHPQLDRFETIATVASEIAGILTYLHYPADSWLPALQRGEQRALRGAPSWNANDRIVRDVEESILRYHRRTLPAVYWEMGCGGEGDATSFASAPSGARFYIASEVGIGVCRNRGVSLADARSCPYWHALAPSATTEILEYEGPYYFLAVWPDGASRVGTFSSYHASPRDSTILVKRP